MIHVPKSDYIYHIDKAHNFLEITDCVWGGMPVVDNIQEVIEEIQGKEGFNVKCMNVLICNESNQWVGYDVKLNVILDINESDLVLAKFNYRTLPNYIA